MTPNGQYRRDAHPRTIRLRFRAAVLMACALLASCDWDSTGPARVARVVVSPSSSALMVGHTKQVTVSLEDAVGKAVRAEVTYSSSDALVASVSAAGLVTARSPGRALIRATAGRHSADAEFAVMPVARVDLTFAFDTVLSGQTVQATASLHAADDAVVEGPITYASADTLIATIDGNGLITARTVGTTQISATGGGESTSLPLVVTAVPVASVSMGPVPGVLLTGDTVLAEAVVLSADGEFPAGNRVRWSVDDVGVAHVDQRGRITALAAGKVHVIVAAGERADSAAITVYLGAGPRVPHFAAIDSAVAELVQKHAIRSATVMLVARGKLAFARSYAWADTSAVPESTRQPVTHATLQASLSRTITSGGVHKLLRDGHLTFEDRPVLEYLAPLTAPAGEAPDLSQTIAESYSGYELLLTNGVRGNNLDIRLPLQRAILAGKGSIAAWPPHDLFEVFGHTR